jgi:hypothetical protein
MTKVKARYDGRVFVPEVPLDLPVGTDVEIPLPANHVAEEAAALASGLARIAKQYPENPDLPTDLATQHDHYLYGTPKRP